MTLLWLLILVLADRASSELLGLIALIYFLLGKLAISSRVFESGPGSRF